MCFLWVTDKQRNWTEAEHICQKEGGHLASVTKEIIQAYIFDRVGQNKVWIGATDQEREGSWEWSDSSPWDFKGWASGEPSGKGEGKERCVELYNYDKDYRGWNDLDCAEALNFTCAMPVSPGNSN